MKPILAAIEKFIGNYWNLFIFLIGGIILESGLLWVNPRSISSWFLLGYFIAFTLSSLLDHVYGEKMRSIRNSYDKSMSEYVDWMQNELIQTRLIIQEHGTDEMKDLLRGKK